MTEASRSLQVTSEYWIEEVVSHGGGDFHILWRTIILGCCSVFRGAAAYLGRPEEEDRCEVFRIEGTDGARCWIDRDVLKEWRRIKPTDEGDYLFVVQSVGRFRLRFPGGALPEVV
jgi:hypothetical protein